MPKYTFRTTSPSSRERNSTSRGQGSRGSASSSRPRGRRDSPRRRERTSGSRANSPRREGDTLPRAEVRRRSSHSSRRSEAAEVAGGKGIRSITQQIRSTERKLADLTQRLQARRTLEQEIRETEAKLSRLKGLRNVQGSPSQESSRASSDTGHQQITELHHPGRISSTGVPRGDQPEMASHLRPRSHPGIRGQKDVQEGQTTRATTVHGRTGLPARELGPLSTVEALRIRRDAEGKPFSKREGLWRLPSTLVSSPAAPDNRPQISGDLRQGGRNTTKASTNPMANGRSATLKQRPAANSGEGRGCNPSGSPVITGGEGETIIVTTSSSSSSSSSSDSSSDSSSSTNSTSTSSSSDSDSEFEKIPETATATIVGISIVSGPVEEFTPTDAANSLLMLQRTEPQGNDSALAAYDHEDPMRDLFGSDSEDDSPGRTWM